MKSILSKFFTIICSIFSIILLLVTIYVFNIYNEVKNIELTLNTPIANTEIYDNSNILVLKDNYLHQNITLDNISPNLINAIIATEDQTFYTNNGINIYRILVAAYNNIISKKIISGASTITQQYVKNTYLNNEKTYVRKLKEILISLELTKKYTKNQILEAYLNSLLFGGSVYGIDMASLYYFNKKPIDLTISEAAMLAGMIQLPNYYNPYIYPNNANKRKNNVLKYMLENDYITNTQYENEVNIKIEDLLSNSITFETYNKYSSYFDYLNYYSKTNNIYSNKQYTYLDINLQNDLYDIVTNKYNHFNNPNIKCAIVAIDNNTCGVKAIVGNSSTDSLVYNYALAKIQPGSTIKPLMDYAPAFEYLHMQPSTIIDDSEYTYSDGTQIHNWDKKYKGKITLRYALKDSRNIPALKLYQLLNGKQKEFINNVGLHPSTLYEADSIGGSSYGYSLLELTSAYTAFANMGYYKETSPIKYYQNNQIYHYIENPSKKVMKDSTAFFINSILHDVFKNSKYDVSNTYLMAKTGQTNYDKQTKLKYNIPDEATKDSLLIAYTKDLTIGIWIGFDKITNTNYLMGSQKQIARHIMTYIMQKYAQNSKPYDLPSDVIKLRIFNDNGQIYLANNESTAYTEYFLKYNMPLTRKKYFPYLAI